MSIFRILRTRNECLVVHDRNGDGVYNQGDQLGIRDRRGRELGPERAAELLRRLTGLDSVPAGINLVLFRSFAGAASAFRGAARSGSTGNLTELEEQMRNAAERVGIRLNEGEIESLSEDSVFRTEDGPVAERPQGSRRRR